LKKPEFISWAMDVKGKDIEGLSRHEEKELFRMYMEDYNTATLPHQKYYDLEAYDQRGDGRNEEPRTGQREQLFDDETARRHELAEQRKKEKQERLKEAYENLKSSDIAKDMREQEILRAKMSLAYRTGDLKEAERIAERLRPDDA